MQVGHSTDEDRRKHLDFIQAVVTRISAASTSTETWLLPVVTATPRYALTNNAECVALLGIAAVLLFAFLGRELPASGDALSAAI